MPFNGAGVYTPPGADFPAVANTLIQSTKFNNVINDLATALTTCLTKDGQTVVTANLPMANFRHTGVGAAVSATDYVRYDQIGSQQVPIGGIGKNAIINGGMRVDQRNIGASQTFTAAASIAYCVDRFYGSCTGANVTGQRVAGTGIHQYAYKFTGAASVTAILFGQRIEAANAWQFASRVCTLQAKISNSLLTTVTWTAYSADVADTFSAKTQIATGTFTVTSTDTVYSANITMPSGATRGIAVEFSVGAQTSGTWTITGVQLEAGSVATEFEYRSYGQELVLCQRYYQKSWSQTVAPLTATSQEGIEFAQGSTVASASVVGRSQYAVPMRATPTVTVSPYTTPSNTGRISLASSTDQAASSGVVSFSGDRGFSVQNSSGGTLTAGSGGFIWHYTATVEL